MLILFRVVIENLIPSEILKKRTSHIDVAIEWLEWKFIRLHESNPKIRNEEVSKSFGIVFFRIILAQSLTCLITEGVNLKFN